MYRVCATLHGVRNAPAIHICRGCLCILRPGINEREGATVQKENRSCRCYSTSYIRYGLFSVQIQHELAWYKITLRSPVHCYVIESSLMHVYQVSIETELNAMSHQNRSFDSVEVLCLKATMCLDMLV